LHELAGFSASGMLIEWRHTYRYFRGAHGRDRWTSRLRNAFRRASRSVEIVVGPDVESFNFEQAIVTPDPAVRARRRALAPDLVTSGCGVVLHAVVDQTIVGG